MTSATVISTGRITIPVGERGRVLESACALDRAQLDAAFEALLRAKEIVDEQAGLVWTAVRLVQSAGAGFGDALVGIAARSGGAGRTVPFDQDAARRSGMQLPT